MYLFLSVAALPFAWSGLDELIYFRAHPEELAAREASLEWGYALLVGGAGLLIMTPLLLLGGSAAVLLVIAGPRALRISALVLLGAWTGSCSAMLAFPFPLQSMEGLYWHSLPYAGLVVLPWLCAAVRLADRRWLHPIEWLENSEPEDLSDDAG